MLDHLKRIFKSMKVPVSESQVVATRTPILPTSPSGIVRRGDLTGDYPPEPKTSAEETAIFWTHCWSQLGCRCAGLAPATDVFETQSSCESLSVLVKSRHDPRMLALIIRLASTFTKVLRGALADWQLLPVLLKAASPISARQGDSMLQYFRGPWVDDLPRRWLDFGEIGVIQL